VRRRQEHRCHQGGQQDPMSSCRACHRLISRANRQYG
jgi:hypothetical protein